jgi:hypothetical protein
VFTWFVGLTLLWAIFCYGKFRENLKYFAGMYAGMALLLIPYFLLLSDRSESTDAVQLLSFTHDPDLWRMPELISYVSIVLLMLSYRFAWLDMDRTKYIFLLSFSLIAPAVFNQQIVTGRSLQPFHYQVFCANYISFFVLATIVLLLLRRYIRPRSLRLAYLVVGLLALVQLNLDIARGNNDFHSERMQMDALVPVAGRIRSISRQQPTTEPKIVMSFDLSHARDPDSTYLPSFSSQAVLWSTHIVMFPDIDSEENQQRLFEFVYFHNYSAAELKNSLENDFLLPLGFFGHGRVFPELTTDSNPITEIEKDDIVRKYDEFAQNFSSDDAKRYELSFVVVRNNSNNDLSAIDRWYDRDSGEKFGPYTLYQVKLRNQ